MANSRANPTGWIFGEILDEVQMNHVDEGQARAVDGRSGQLQIESHSVTRLAEAQPVWRPALDTDLLLNAPWDVATLTTNYVEFWWPLKVPNGAIITGWSVTVRGDGGHAGAPANKPIVNLQSAAGGHGFVADGSASGPAFDAVHTISQTGLSVTVDNTTSNTYYLVIGTESGANARASTRYSKASVTFLVAKLDEG